MINIKSPGFSLIEVLVVLTLLTLLVVFFGTKADNWAVGQGFHKPCHAMEDLKEAIIGRPGIYCNGIRQFTGYVSDMGTLPGLFYIDKDSGRAVQVHYHSIDDELLAQILDGSVIVQPKALWIRDLDSDGKDDLCDDVLWRYRAKGRFWAGWRGPYIRPPRGGVLRDAWANPLIFIMGELVTIPDPQNPNKTKTYQCIKTHDASFRKNMNEPGPRAPGTPEGAPYWKELKDSQDRPVRINAKTWVHPGKGSAPGKGLPVRRDTFYADAMVVISYGKDGKPGGEGLDKDLVLTIYREQFTGEVAGHVGYQRGAEHKYYARSVTIHYPVFTEKGPEITSKSIHIQPIDEGYGINFHFGSAPSKHCVEWATVEVPSDDPEDDESEYVLGCSKLAAVSDPNSSEQISIPIGIRSITAGPGKTYIFPVTEGGNWVGTLK